MRDSRQEVRAVKTTRRVRESCPEFVTSQGDPGHPGDWLAVNMHDLEEWALSF